MQKAMEMNDTAADAAVEAGAMPVTSVEINASENDANNNNKSVQDIQTARQTKLSSLKMLDFTDKASVSSRKMQKAEPPVDSTVVAEFQRLRRLRRRHSESNLLRNDGSGLPGIASRAPHRHGLSSSLNSSGSTISMNSSPGASNSEGDTVLDLFLSPMSSKSSDLQRSAIIDKNYPSACSSPVVSQRTPRPLSPVVTQRTSPLSPATTPRAASPLSPVSPGLSPRQSPLASPVSPKASQPKSPATSKRKPSPLTLEDTPRASSASQKSRPLAPVPPKPPDSTSPRVSLPDSPREAPDSPQGTMTDQQQDLSLSPRNQNRRVNSGSKHFEITLQDIDEHRERNGEDGRKKRLGQHPKKMLVRRNSEPPNGMTRRLRMAGLANEEAKRGGPQVRITQELLAQKQGSDESICSSICEDEELKEKCLNWLQTIENP